MFWLFFGCDDADLVVKSTLDLGMMAAPEGIVARDGGQSGLFQERSVWIYHDTLTERPGVYPTTGRNNTMSWTTDFDASDGLLEWTQPEGPLGAPKEFFPQTKEEQDFTLAHLDLGDGKCQEPCGARYAIWGGGPIALNDKQALLPYQKVYAEPGETPEPKDTGTGGITFSESTTLGTSFAVWTDFNQGPERPETDAGFEDVTMLFDAETEGLFVTAPNLVDEYLYVFACTGGDVEDRSCRLARAPADDWFTRSIWAFRTENGWSSKLEDAEVLFNGAEDMTVHYNAHLDRWLAVYREWGAIRARTAPELHGPWSLETTLARADAEFPIRAFTHEELAQNGGATLTLTFLDVEDTTFHLMQINIDPR